ncbi:MAG: NAD(+)/NADH kinase [Candidatus Omnitrophica bacterium]|nr:NAD(+)/NADH kinase [Candidatus Omnitrophota bacterium]MDD5671380.1 NAD(+)/NADH kinase [Candidatus Omnitrophota bacterium]
MRKVGIVANLNKQGAAGLLNKLREWLEKRDAQVWLSGTHSVEQIVEESELIICLGGDGTMLAVADHMKVRSVPILGVNLGSLGFLTEVKQDEVFEELNSYFLDQSVIEERLMLSCSTRSEKTKQERRFVALNDIVISREGLTRLLRVDVFVTGEKLTSFSGDGLIIATPTGSTAYSLSAGGAVVHPKLEALVITPICPHASALRSLVVRGDEKISVRIQTNRDGEKALLTADGQENVEIDDSFNVEITRSNTPVKLVKSSKRSYLATLRENFKFPV